MCNQKYNGWHNWETWNCNLWFDDFFTEDAANMYAMAEDINEAVLLLEVGIEETVIELITEGIPDSGFAADIINQGLHAVDFREIAEHYIDDMVID